MSGRLLVSEFGNGRANMTNPPDRDTWLHPDLNKNRQAFPPDELKKYWGRHVAWSWDGTKILADGATLGEVADRLQAMGINTSRVVFDYVDDPNEGSQVGWL
jgi:hypothetical protein